MLEDVSVPGGGGAGQRPPHGSWAHAVVGGTVQIGQREVWTSAGGDGSCQRQRQRIRQYRCSENLEHLLKGHLKGSLGGYEIGQNMEPATNNPSLNQG